MKKNAVGLDNIEILSNFAARNSILWYVTKN